MAGAYQIGLDEGRAEGAEAVAVLAKRIDELKADRDEWKQQHENLLAMYQAQTAEVERLRAAPPPGADQRQPIPVTEIVLALEREAEGYGDARWLAASHLRRMSGWETRTLMCRIDTRPSTCSTATKCASPELPPRLDVCPACNCGYGDHWPSCSAQGEEV